MNLALMVNIIVGKQTVHGRSIYISTDMQSGEGLFVSIDRPNWNPSESSTPAQ